MKILKGAVDISEKRLIRMPKNADDTWFFKDVKIDGDFYCTWNNLTSLEGCPEEITGVFSCWVNQIESLEYGPKIVGDRYSCANNLVKSLKGVPQRINGDFSCEANLLTTLEHGPTYVNGDYDCGSNNLVSFKGIPREIRGGLSLSYNKNLDSLEHFPEFIGENLYVSGCDNFKFTEAEIRKVCDLRGRLIK